METISDLLVNLTELADDHDHDHHDHDDENINLAKGVAMAVLFCASMIFGLLPFFLARTLKWQQLNKDSNIIVSTLLSFGGGVLLSTTLLHMLPEISETISHLQEEEKLPTFVFSLAPFLMACGFFVIYFVEELVHAYLHSHQQKTINHTAAFTRGRSARESLHAPRKSAEEPSSLSTVSTAELVSNQHVHHSHSHSHSHHSHIPQIEQGDLLVSSLRGLLIVLALSVHELFEGLAVGLESTTGSVWYMFGAVAAHKLVIAFCIGVELVATKTKTWLGITYVFIFAVVSPLGIGIGMILSSGDGNLDVPSVILQGLASGTLLYVIFFEILSKHRSGFLQFFAVLVGFFLMFGFKFIVGHNHSHGETDEDHDHNH